MQRTRFDFDVIAGPAPPRAAPVPESPPKAAMTDPVLVERQGDDTEPGIPRQ